MTNRLSSKVIQRLHLFLCVQANVTNDIIILVNSSQFLTVNLNFNNKQCMAVYTCYCSQSAIAILVIFYSN